jgi:hypothetical protein
MRQFQVVQKVVAWCNNHQPASVVIVFFSVVIMVFPRFNGNDIALIRPFVGLQQGVHSPDVQNYIHFTEYFKGVLPIDSVEKPFSYRPAVPFLASLFPVDSLLGIVIVNVLASVISIVCIFLLLKHHRFEFGLCIIGCLLFAISFPLMYYSSAGYIDASAICVICSIVVATVYRRYFYLPFLFIVGALVKEVTIISLSFVLIHIYNYNKKSKFIKMLLPVGLSVAVYGITSYIVRTNFGVGISYLWKPTIFSIQENIARPKTYLSFLLTFGVVGLFGVAQLINDARRRNRAVRLREFFRNYQYTPHMAGILSSFALSLFAFISAYADGRFFWTAYPFLIPPAVQFIHDLGVQKKNKPI